MPDPSELIFPDEPDFIPPRPPQTPIPRPPMRPPTPPLCSIQGTVKNRFGFPIGGAKVTLYTSAAERFRSIQETRSDRFGRFSFSRVRPARYTVVALWQNRSARRNVWVNSRNCRIQNINIKF